MSGWELRQGALTSRTVSEDEYWSLFNFVFSDGCKKTNTYKFGLIKSICDQVYNLYEVGDGYYLSYESIFSRFAVNYWNLVNKYHIKQMLFNGKSEYSKIERILMEAAKKKDVPEDLSYETLPDEQKTSITKIVTSECKRYVVGALYHDFEGKLYAFDLRGSGLYLGKDAYAFISKYKKEIETLNYYAWARFLEKANDDVALMRILEKLDTSTPKRGDLSLYRELLYREFEENSCFYCGRKLKDIHVDHFIPWSFIKDDKLWNFVLSCPSCNLKKKAHLASLHYVDSIEKRNLDIKSKITMRSDQLIQSEFDGYKQGHIMKIWEYARMSGYREVKRIS